MGTFTKTTTFENIGTHVLLNVNAEQSTKTNIEINETLEVKIPLA